jgi:putative toxin-antitoxin system antitoxin component (TIGR02293 family)
MSRDFTAQAFRCPHGGGIPYWSTGLDKQAIWLNLHFMQSAFVLAEKPLHELVPQLRKGLPVGMLNQVAETLGFSASLLAGKLGIARRTLTRKQSNGTPLSLEASEKVLRVARVRNLARTLFTTDEAISRWLSQPDTALGNAAPLDILDTELGSREVENLLRALAYGHVV